jgi:hypothetical protein
MMTIIVVIMGMVVGVGAVVSYPSVVTATVSPMIEMRVGSTSFTVACIGSITVSVTCSVTWSMVVVIYGSIAVTTVISVPSVVTSTVVVIWVPVSMISTSATISGPRSITVSITCWMAFAHVSTVVVSMSHVSVIVVSMVIMMVVVVIVMSVTVVIGIVYTLR